jgi:ribose transport system substrate-binding protein
LAVVALSVSLAACGGSGSDEESADATATEAATEAADTGATEAADTGATAVDTSQGAIQNGDPEAPLPTGSVEEMLAWAKADVERFQQLTVSFSDFDPGPAPAPPQGVETGSVTCLWAVPACQHIADGIESAMESIGWTPTVVDGTADQRNQVVALRSFLTAGFAGFVLAAIDPNGVSDLLGQAETDGIPWTMIAGVDPRPFGGFGPDLDVTGGYIQAGQELGAWVANDSGGEAKILVMSSTDNPAILLRDRGFIEYLERFPGIEWVDNTAQHPIYVPFANLGPPLQSQVQSILQAHPEGEIDYIYTPFDGYATFVVQAAQALGRDEVKVLGFDGAPQNVEFIRNGQNMAATQATAYGWCAWQAVDQLNRALGGAEPYEGGCPSLIIDKDHLPPEGEEWWDGGIDYQAEFERIWSEAQ